MEKKNNQQNLPKIKTLKFEHFVQIHISHLLSYAYPTYHIHIPFDNK